MVLLGPEQVESFHRHGYVPVGPLRSVEQVETLRSSLDELWNRWAESLGVSQEDYCRVVSQWTNVWESHATFARQLRDRRLAAMAAALIGCQEVRLFHDHVISKPPQHSHTIPWHQDYPYWPLSAPRAVSLWLALDDADVESGCMHFMPGAHREGERPAVDFLNNTTDWGERLRDQVAVPVPAGWGIFHHCLSWHTTPPNRSSRPRRAYITIFMDAACTYSPSHSEWHPMNKRVRVAPGEIFNEDCFPLLGGSG